MEPLYTKEDLIDLVAAAPPYNIINLIYFYALNGHAYNNKDCKDLKECLYKEFPQMSKLFYEIPLDLIPLLINHDNNLVKAIVMWRLRIAK
jgi:hypothetical protein